MCEMGQSVEGEGVCVKGVCVCGEEEEVVRRDGGGGVG